MGVIVNAGLEAEVSLKTPNAIGAVATSTVGNIVTYTLTILPAAVYVVRGWLSDDTTGALSTTMPDVSGVVDWGDVLTDANGQHVFTVEHAGAHTWYFNWALIAVRQGGQDATEFS